MRFIIVLDVDGELAAEPARHVQALFDFWRAALCVPRVWVVDIPKANAHYAEAMLEQLSVTFRLLDPRATALLESR